MRQEKLTLSHLVSYKKIKECCKSIKTLAALFFYCEENRKKGGWNEKRSEAA